MYYFILFIFIFSSFLSSQTNLKNRIFSTFSLYLFFGCVGLPLHFLYYNFFTPQEQTLVRTT